MNDDKQPSLAGKMRTKIKNIFRYKKKAADLASDQLQAELAAYYAESSRLSNQQLVAELTTFSCEGSPLISIVAASRKKGNPNSGLPNFFVSLLKMTADVSRVEVVIRLDDDDDLAFYHSIRKKFGSQVRMRFVVKKTVDGFRNLFALHSSAFEHTTFTSCIISLATDDATFRKKNWDIHFIGFARTHKDNIFFINTSHPHLLKYDNADSFFWHLWCQGPTACLPAVGRRVLNINKSVADKYPGWLPYGNNMLCDSFNESLQYHFFKITGRRPPLAMMPNTLLIEEDTNIAAHKEGGLHSYSPVIIDCYRKMVSNETQAVIKEMAQALCTEQGTEHPVTRHLLESDFAPTQPGHNVVISLIAKTYQENRGHGFYDQFLKSLLQTTEQLARVEIIFIMSDHVKYYEKLAKEYGDKIRITLLHANPVKRNGLSLIDHEMLERLAPNSKMVCLVNEAVTFNKMHWDNDVFAISQKYIDHLYFINCHSSCATNYEEKNAYFWEMLRNGYPGFSQIISRRIIENIYQQALSRYLNIGKEYRNDYLFIGAIQYYLWAMTGVNRTHYIENMLVTNKDYDPGNPAVVAADAFYDFMQPQLQTNFQNVATQIIKLAGTQARAENVV